MRQSDLPGAVYDGQQRLTRLLGRSLAPVLAPFIGLPATKATGRILARALFPTVRAARRQNQVLANAFYREQKALDMPDADPIEPPELSPYVVEGLEVSVTRVLEARKFAEGTRTVDNDDLETLVMVADQHARTGYRNQMVAYSLRDPDIDRWARIDPKPPTCWWCRRLISRGPVYNSAESAGDRNSYHPGCTCIPVPKFKGAKTYPGQEFTAREQERYRESRKGLSGKAADRAYRAAVRAANGPTEAEG